MLGVSLSLGGMTCANITLHQKSLALAEAVRQGEVSLPPLRGGSNDVSSEAAVCSFLLPHNVPCLWGEIRFTHLLIHSFMTHPLAAHCFRLWVWPLEFRSEGTSCSTSCLQLKNFRKKKPKTFTELYFMLRKAHTF